ncbi:MAG: hypothetical protein JWR58_3453 [Pseudonocardia sp.]|nr:hypothetical protein [Pseudonocardia sp.]
MHCAEARPSWSPWCRSRRDPHRRCRPRPGPMSFHRDQRRQARVHLHVPLIGPHRPLRCRPPRPQRARRRFDRGGYPCSCRQHRPGHRCSGRRHRRSGRRQRRPSSSRPVRRGRHRRRPGGRPGRSCRLRRRRDRRPQDRRRRVGRCPDRRRAIRRRGRPAREPPDRRVRPPVGQNRWNPNRPGRHLRARCARAARPTGHPAGRHRSGGNWSNRDPASRCPADPNWPARWQNHRRRTDRPRPDRHCPTRFPPVRHHPVQRRPVQHHSGQHHPVRPHRPVLHPSQWHHPAPDHPGRHHQDSRCRGPPRARPHRPRRHRRCPTAGCHLDGWPAVRSR